MPSDKDILVEAREMADDFRYDIQPSVRAMLRALVDEVERLRKDNADLTAVNIGNLLGEIKQRLTPEEGQQFQLLLMSATMGWVDEVTERTAVDRGLLDAFKDLPKKRKRRAS